MKPPAKPTVNTGIWGLSIITVIAAVYLNSLMEILIPLTLLCLLLVGLGQAVPSHRKQTHLHRMRLMIICILFVLIIAAVADIFGHTPRLIRWSAVVGHGVLGIGLFLITISVVMDLFTASRVSWQSIASAIFGYLLLALAWAHFYLLLHGLGLEVLDPSISRHPPGSLNKYFEVLYFSLVTLSTLGYGDIRPVHLAARLLASGQAVVGQLYMAVLIGGLLGMYLKDRKAKDDKKRK